MNSPPYGYGGLIAETIVLAVRIIMSPTCSNRDLAGRNALSATDLTICSPPEPIPPIGARPRTSQATQTEDYVMGPPFATHNRRA